MANSYLAQPLTSPNRRLSFGALGRILRQNFFPCLGFLLVFWTIAIIVIGLTPVTYLASTQVLLEPLQRKQTLGPVDAALDQLDSAQADSRMQVFKSERLLRFVFDTVNWPQLDDSLSAPPSVNPLARMWHSFAHPPETLEKKRTRQLVDFMNLVSVRRLGLSYVLEISFQAKTPKLAAQMANAVTAAYIRSLVVSSQREGELLERRLTNAQTEEALLLNGVKQGMIPDAEIPDANARVISAALEPVAKATPKSMLILLFATAAGLAISIGLALFRHISDRTLQSEADVLTSLDFKCFAALPRNDMAASARGKVTRMFRPKALQFLLTELLTAGRNPRGRSVGFVACHAGEGTSSIVYEAARLAADCGASPAVIDANIDNPGLTQRLSTIVQMGLLDALEAPEGVNLPTISLDGLRFLGRGVTRVEARSAFFGSAKMRDILDCLKAGGPVLVDLPPLETSSEAQAIASVLDSVVLVAEAGRSTLEDVSKAMLKLPPGRIAGIILNKVQGQKELRAPRVWTKSAVEPANTRSQMRWKKLS